MKRRLIYSFSILFSMSISIASNAMTFSTPLENTINGVISGQPLEVKIYAVGPIEADTPDKFKAFVKRRNIHSAEVYLDSLGGSVAAAMKLGELIRDYGFSTNIGELSAVPFDKDKNGTIYRGKVEPTTCASACSYVYAGGKNRYWTTTLDGKKSSMLGVHRFYSSNPNTSLDEQGISGAIVAYWRKMGIDPLVFSLSTMTRNGESHDVIWLDEKEAEKFNFVNHGISSPTVEVKISPQGSPYLKLEQNMTAEDRNGARILICYEGKGKFAVLGGIVTDEEKTANMAEITETTDLFINSESLGLKKIDKTTFEPRDSVLWVIRFVPRKKLLSLLNKKKDLTISAWANTGGALAFPSFVQIKSKGEKDKVLEFVRNVR